MANKYFSRRKYIFARNITENTADIPLVMPVVPADFVVLAADIIQNQLFFTLRSDINVNSNIIIRGIGLFCNFADGFVFKDPFDRVDLTINAFTVTDGAAVTGAAVAVAYGSKALVSGGGGAFIAEIPAGTIIYHNQRYYSIKSVTDNDNAVLDDYSQVTATGAFNIAAPDALGAQSATIFDINTLNTIHEIDDFAQPAALTTAGVTPVDILFTAVMNQNHALTFLTKSINSAFGGDDVNFDVVTEIEYTPITL